MKPAIPTLVFALLAALAPPAAAQGERPWSVELGAGWLAPGVEDGRDGDFEGPVLSLRAGWHFREAWSLRLGLSRHEESVELGRLRPPFGQVERARVRAVEFSVERRWPLGGSSLHAFGGAGLRELVRRVATDAEEFESVRERSPSLGLGVAWELPLGRRAYLRPELAGRHSEDGGDLQGSVAVGLRFGRAGRAQGASQRTE